MKKLILISALVFSLAVVSNAQAPAKKVVAKKEAVAPEVKKDVKVAPAVKKGGKKAPMKKVEAPAKK